MSADICLALRADLSGLLDGLVPVSSSVGPRGEAVLLLVNEADRPIALGHDGQPGWASFPHSRAARSYTGVAVLHDGAREQRSILQDVSLAFPFLQPLLGDELLLVGARCHRFGDGTAERNAQIFGSDGELRRELCFGDGIRDVQARGADDIWVAYRDEGIFGNYGWGLHGDATPLGSSGLVRFDAAGARRWTFVPPAGFGSMVDCYALNVADQDTWAYYYTDFPLVRIGPDFTVRAWQTEVGGARALAVDGRRVLLYGGYASERERCILAEIGEGSLTHPRECRLVLPSGEAMSGGRIVGRGSILHVFAGSNWYQTDIRCLP